MARGARGAAVDAPAEEPLSLAEGTGGGRTAGDRAVAAADVARVGSGTGSGGRAEGTRRLEGARRFVEGIAAGAAGMDDERETETADGDRTRTATAAGTDGWTAGGGTDAAVAVTTVTMGGEARRLSDAAEEAATATRYPPFHHSKFPPPPPSRAAPH